MIENSNHTHEPAEKPVIKKKGDEMAAKAYAKVRSMWVAARKMNLIPAVPDDVADSRSAEDISIDRLWMVLAECMFHYYKPNLTGIVRYTVLLDRCAKAARSAIESMKTAGVTNLLQLCQRNMHDVDGLDPWARDRVCEMKAWLAGEDGERISDKGHGYDKAI